VVPFDPEAALCFGEVLPFNKGEACCWLAGVVSFGEGEAFCLREVLPFNKGKACCWLAGVLPFGKGEVPLFGKGTGSVAASLWKESINFRFEGVARGASGPATLNFTDDPELQSHIDQFSAQA